MLLLATEAWADNVMKCSQQPKFQCSSALDFGAKCDGTTDDSAALQAAVDSMTSTRGVVVIPAGKRCAVATALALKANVTISCEKGGGFKWLAGAAAIIQNTGSTLDDWAVEGCTFDLNSAATTPAFVMGSGTRFVFNDNIVRNPSTSSGTTAYNLVDITCAKNVSSSDGSGQIIGNKIFGSNTLARLDTGLRVQPCSQFNLGAGPVIQGNEIKNTGGRGIWIDRGATSFEGTTAVISGNTVTGTLGYGLYLGTGANNVVGNYVYTSGVDAIRVCGETSNGVDDKSCGNNVLANNVILTTGSNRAVDVIAWSGTANVSGNRIIGNYSPGGVVIDAKGTCSGGSTTTTLVGVPIPNKCDSNADCSAGGTCGSYPVTDHNTIFGNIFSTGNGVSAIVVENGDDILITSNTDVTINGTNVNPGAIYLKNLDTTADTGYTIIGNELGGTFTGAGAYNGITFDEASTGGFSSMNVVGNTVGSRTRASGVATTGVRFINGAVCRECSVQGNNLAGAATSVSGWSPAFGYLDNNLGTVNSPDERRQCSITLAQAGATAPVAGDIVGSGCVSALTNTGGVTHASRNDSDGAYDTLTTGASANDRICVTTTAGINWAARQHQPVFQATFKLPTTITTVRYMIGLGANDPSNADDVANMAMLRYSTTTDGTAFWRAVTRDAGGTATVATTTSAVASDTRYVVRVDCSDTTTANCRFYINEFLAATATATLPVAATQMTGWLCVTAKSGAAARAISFAKLTMEAQ